MRIVSPSDVWYIYLDDSGRLHINRNPAFRSCWECTMYDNVSEDTLQKLLLAATEAMRRENDCDSRD